MVNGKNHIRKKDGLKYNEFDTRRSIKEIEQQIELCKTYGTPNENHLKTLQWVLNQEE